MPTPINACLIAALVWLVAVAARAESMLASPHTEESSFILGAKSVASLQHLERRAEATAIGVALFGETTLVRDKLELELGVALSRTLEGVEYAFEPLFKLPLSGTRRADPYLALGPLLRKAHELPLVYGAQVSAGAYVWLYGSFGLDLDCSLAVLRDHGTALELALGAGPVWRI